MFGKRRLTAYEPRVHEAVSVVQCSTVASTKHTQTHTHVNKGSWKGTYEEGGWGNPTINLGEREEGEGERLRGGGGWEGRTRGENSDTTDRVQIVSRQK